MPHEGAAERGAEWLAGEEGDEAAGAPAPTTQPEVPAPVDWNADEDNDDEELI